MTFGKFGERWFKQGVIVCHEEFNERQCEIWCCIIANIVCKKTGLAKDVLNRNSRR